MIEHKLREIQKVKINGIDWAVLIDDVPDTSIKGSYWYANTYHRWIVMGNIIDDGLPLGNYLIDKIVMEAKQQYTRN